MEKLRQLKGSKHKYEVSELENVYDEVDEKIYSKTVMDRQNDDWIVDDGMFLMKKKKIPLKKQVYFFIKGFCY